MTFVSEAICTVFSQHQSCGVIFIAPFSIFHGSVSAVPAGFWKSKFSVSHLLQGASPDGGRTGGEPRGGGGCVKSTLNASVQMPDFLRISLKPKNISPSTA